jgi:hypothetical protein
MPVLLGHLAGAAAWLRFVGGASRRFGHCPRYLAYGRIPEILALAISDRRIRRRTGTTRQGRRSSSSSELN